MQITKIVQRREIPFESLTGRWKYDLAGAVWFKEEEKGVLEGEGSCRRWTLRLALPHGSSLSLESLAEGFWSWRSRWERRDILLCLPEPEPDWLELILKSQVGAVLRSFPSNLTCFTHTITQLLYSKHGIAWGLRQRTNNFSRGRWECMSRNRYEWYFWIIWKYVQYNNTSRWKYKEVNKRVYWDREAELARNWAIMA